MPKPIPQHTEGGAALESALLGDFDIRRPARTHRAMAALLGVNHALISQLINGLANPGSRATTVFWLVLGIDPVLWWTSLGGDRGDMLELDGDAWEATAVLAAHLEQAATIAGQCYPRDAAVAKP
jgi:hypothetical protein